jgi:pimeloyl-ACP methyl ester carboxylesterase
MWSRSVTVDDADQLGIAATEWSRRGTPCVLLHGLGDAAFVWSDLAIRIMPYYRVVGFDLRGHGDSDWDPDARYNSATFAADLARLVAAFGFERFVLIGHSLGAAAAIRFAAANPAQVIGLVIVDFGPELDSAGVEEVLRTVAEMPRSYGSPDEYAKWLVARRPFGNKELLQRFALRNLRASAVNGWVLKSDAALAANSEISTIKSENGRHRIVELWPALGRIKCPTLLIRGIGSGVLGPEVASRMVDQVLPAGRLVTVRDAGHAVMMDNPAEFHASVIRFLQEL